MSNEMITQLPTVTSASLSDIIYAVQGYVSPSSPGTSVQETLQQVLNLMLGQTIIGFAGDPNGSLAGQTFQLAWDGIELILWVCTTSGNAATAVWTQAASQTTLGYAGNPNGNVAGRVWQLLWDGTDLILWVCTTTGNAAGAVWTAVNSSASAPASPTMGGTDVSNPTAHTLPVAEGASAFNFLGPLTNGQLLIGHTGADPTPATLSAGPGVSIANGAGTITISGTASGIGWTDVTGATQAMVADNGYTADRSTLVTFTLPATAAFGTGLAVIGKGSGGWSIAQNAGQNIQIGSVSSTVGAGGSVSSTNQFDSINLVCTTANTTWSVSSAPQSAGLTIV